MLFDLDGTLVDSLQGIAATVDAVLERYGQAACDRAMLRGLIGAPLEDIFCRLGAGPPAAAATAAAAAVAATVPAAGGEAAWVREYVAAYLATYPSLGVPNSPPFPGVAALLDRCVDAGLRLALVTTKQTGIARDVLEAIGASRYFDAVIGADAASHLKPHPAPARAALAALQLPPEATAVVGDTAFDIGMARAAGCRAIGVAWGYSSPAALLEAGADEIAESPPALAERLTAN